MNTPIYHRHCGRVAFTYDHAPQIGEPFPLGEHVVPPKQNGTIVVCEGCQIPICDPSGELRLGHPCNPHRSCVECGRP